MGLLSLVLWFPFFLLGVVAWGMGTRDIRKMKSGLMDPSGRSLTQAGRFCGLFAILPVLSIALVTVLWSALEAWDFLPPELEFKNLLERLQSGS